MSDEFDQIRHQLESGVLLYGKDEVRAILARIRALEGEVKNWEAYFDDRIQDSPKIKRLEAEVEAKHECLEIALNAMNRCDRDHTVDCLPILKRLDDLKAALAREGAKR